MSDRIAPKISRYLVYLVWIVSVCLLAGTAYRLAGFCAWQLHQYFGIEQIACENPICNFGEVAQGSKPECTFLLKNTGSRAVTIYKVVPGCGGCVEVSNFQQKTIEPRNTMSISVALMTKETIGQVRKAVLISYGSWYKQNLVVYLEALVNPSLEKDDTPSEQSNSSD